MNQQHRSAIIGVLVAVVAGTGAYMLWPQQTLAPEQKGMEAEETKVEDTEKTDTAVKPAATQPKTVAKPKTSSSPAVTAGGTYEAYSASAVGYAALGEVVLFFYSPSCPACVLLDKDIVTNAARIPKDVKILKVDFDTATDLKTKYGVMESHKLIQVNSAGNRITQWSLSSTLSDLVTKIVRY